MAKSCTVNVYISEDNISMQGLSRCLQEMHIEAVKEILGNMDLTDSQMNYLLMVLQRKGKSGL